MADRPRRECRRVRTFLEETAAAQRRAADAKRQRREEEATRQEELDKAEAPLTPQRRRGHARHARGHAMHVIPAGPFQVTFR